MTDLPARTVACSLFLVLCGCATLDKNQCLHANWYAVGLEDGAQGRPLERLGEHRRACAEHAVMPDAEGIREPHARSREVEKLEQLSREAEQLEDAVARASAQ